MASSASSIAASPWQWIRIAHPAALAARQISAILRFGEIGRTRVRAVEIRLRQRGGFLLHRAVRPELDAVERKPAVGDLPRLGARTERREGFSGFDRIRWQARAQAHGERVGEPREGLDPFGLDRARFVQRGIAGGGRPLRIARPPLWPSVPATWVERRRQ